MDENFVMEAAAKAYVKVQNQPFVEEDLMKAIAFGIELSRHLEI